MNDIWSVLVPVLISILGTAGVIVGGAKAYIELRGIAFWDRKTAEFKEKQLKEETDRLAKVVSEENATNLAVRLDPMDDRLAKMEARLNTVTELSNVQKKLLENQGVDIAELISGKSHTEILLEKSVAEQARLNEIISILAIGYQNLNQNFRDAGIKYDGAADTILEPSKRTIAQTSENVPADVKAQMK